MVQAERKGLPSRIKKGVNMECMGIERYLEHVGEQVVADIVRAARPLYGMRLLHINSTFHGGGVAMMLNSLVPLMNDVGINADWNLLYGDPSLFLVTKKLHNALQGEEVELSESEIDSYLYVNETFARFSPISQHDVVVVHDPQPLPMIRYRQKENPWVWRCHIDLSAPCEHVWKTLKPLILRYDTAVVSTESFRKPDLPTQTFIIPPAIDPLTAISKEISKEEARKTLAEHGLASDKPIILQVSRFDKWKDPLGVINVFQRVRKEVDCQLVMIGNMAADDPEGPQIYEDIVARSQDVPDIHLITQTNALLVNALQRCAAVALQLSRREGFGLTVAEALWKKTPVVATDVGGIPLQVKHGQTGYLVQPRDYDATAEHVVRLLRDPDLARELGEQGKEHVRQRFLLPRLLLDWLRLLGELT